LSSRFTSEKLIDMSRPNRSPLRQRAYHFLSRRIAIFLLLAMGSYASRSVAQQAIQDNIQDKKIGDLKVTILSTMLVSTPGASANGGSLRWSKPMATRCLSIPALRRTPC